MMPTSHPIVPVVLNVVKIVMPRNKFKYHTTRSTAGGGYVLVLLQYGTDDRCDCSR